MRPAALPAVAAGLLAIAGNAVPASESKNAAAHFACGPHQVRLMVGDSAPSLMISGERRAVQRTRTASGVGYRTTDGDPPVVFRQKGASARMQIGKGEAIECRSVEKAEREPLPFEARGQEPGWKLDITPERIRMTADYGEKVVTAPRPSPLGFDNGRLYRTETGDHGMTVRITDRVCHDAMSAAPFPATVEVTLDGETYHGCGGDPKALLTGAVWSVSELDGAAPPTEWPSTLVFTADGRLYGHAGCNAYQTSYTINGPEFVTGPVAKTKKMCGTAVMQQEDTFLRLLGSAANWRIGREGALRLEAGDGGNFVADRDD